MYPGRPQGLRWLIWISTIFVLTCLGQRLVDWLGSDFAQESVSALIVGLAFLTAPYRQGKDN